MTNSGSSLHSHLCTYENVEPHPLTYPIIILQTQHFHHLRGAFDREQKMRLSLPPCFEFAIKETAPYLFHFYVAVGTYLPNTVYTQSDIRSPYSIPQTIRYVALIRHITSHHTASTPISE